MGTVDNRVSEFTKKLPFFAGLPEDDMKAFFDAATVHEYKKGAALFHQGDVASAFYVIISGWTKLTRSTAEGEQALVALFTRGDVFGEAVLFAGSNYPVSAHAAEDTRALVIPGSVLKARARANPDITTRMLECLTSEINSLHRQNEQMALMKSPQRVSCLLLQLSSHMLGSGGTFTFPYDKALAAARLGMTPETFSRALSQLKPYGVISKGPEITIGSFEKLAAYSCGHCTAVPGECGGCRLSAVCGTGQKLKASAKA